MPERYYVPVSHYDFLLLFYFISIILYVTLDHVIRYIKMWNYYCLLQSSTF